MKKLKTEKENLTKKATLSVKSKKQIMTEAYGASEFMKFDGEKVRMELVPPSAINAMAEILTIGARKYAPNNWKNCEDLDRYRGAMMRHFEAYRDGEFNDPETDKPHLWHAMCNLAFLIELDKEK